MANNPREGTRPRVVRMADDLWESAERKAAAEDPPRKMPKLLRDLLTECTGRDPAEVDAMHGRKAKQ